MTRTLVVGPTAEREIEEAPRWYEERATGLGQAVVDEVLHALGVIEEGPHTLNECLNVYLIALRSCIERGKGY